MRRIVRRDDEGVALVAAVGVVMLVTLLLATLIAYALSETRQTGRDRQRSSAVMSAEGGVDTTLARMQGSSLTSLPCGSSVSSAQSAPDRIDVVTRVTYYDSAGGILSCPLAAGAPVAQALVSTTSTSNALAGQAPAKRTMESLVQLSPAPALNKAIFGNLGVEMNKHLELYGSQPGRSDADVYSNDHVTCNGDGTYRGSLIVQGTITLGAGCNVVGNAWATTGVTASSTSLGGVLASAGNVALANSTSVANMVRASGTIKNTAGGTWSGCPGKCAAGTTVEAPPAEAFPRLPYDTAPWIAAGYSPTVITKNNCSSGYADEAADWILANAATLAQPTILRTTCQNGIYFKNNGDITLGNNLVIFTDGGISFKNNASFVSNNTTMRYLYIIQPYGSPYASMPCTVDGIDMKNNLDVAPTVSTLFYTPCNISNKNNATFYGQMYSGGVVSAKMNLTVTYQPLPVYGVLSTTPTYNVDILFKREARSS